MIGYTPTPDYYNDVICHKDHKYISKHKGPSGKWIYVYKSRKAEEKARKYRDKLANTQMQNFFDRNYKDGIDPLVETTNIKGNYKNKYDRSIGTFTYRTTGDKWNPNEPLKRSGRPKSYGYDSGREGARSVKTTKVKLPSKPKRGGYTNSANASQTKKHVSTTKVGLNNLTKKGYSGSTSGSAGTKSIDTTKINKNKIRIMNEAKAVNKRRKNR